MSRAHRGLVERVVWGELLTCRCFIEQLVHSVDSRSGYRGPVCVSSRPLLDSVGLCPFCRTGHAFAPSRVIYRNIGCYFGPLVTDLNGVFEFYSAYLIYKRSLFAKNTVGSSSPESLGSVRYNLRSRGACTHR